MAEAPPGGAVLTGISSMAARRILQALGAGFAGRAGCEVRIEFAGGVDAARRVREGEAFDTIFLASGAIEGLIAEGKARPGTRVDYATSGIAVAVASGARVPDVSTAQAVRAAVLAARRIGYSTGPSGVALAEQFRRWGIVDQLAGKVVQAPPGVPVGALIARGEIDLGFQQFSELQELDGIRVAGPLPPDIQVLTTFSGAIGANAASPELARRFLAYLSEPSTAAVKQRHGMQAA